jgi:hypothetical protein
VFDPNVQWTFLIEMMKIADENGKVKYPAITKSIGAPPKQYKQVVPPKEELSPEMAMAALLNDDEMDEEEEAPYKSIAPVEEAIEEDDISSLEGEEGEEELETDDSAEEFGSDEDEDS